VAEAVFPNLSSRTLWEGFFLNTTFKGVAYENIKLKDDIDMEVQANLDFINFYWHCPNNPTTFKKIVPKDF
jgi:hypothetical protein